MTLKRILLGTITFTLLAGAAFQYRGIRHDLVSVVTSGSARTLTNTSTQVQRFTGSTAQTVNLPDATTLGIGMWYTIINESSAMVTVNNGASEAVTTLPAASQGSPISKRLYLTSNSTNGGPWTIDQGAGSGSSSGGSEIAGEAYIAGTAGCEPTRSSTTFGQFTDDTDCPGPTIVEENLGDWLTTDSDNIEFAINDLPAGRYVGYMNVFLGNGTAGAYCNTYFSDGTFNSSGGAIRVDNTGTAYSSVTMVIFLDYATSGNRTFTVFGKGSAGNCYLFNYDGASAFFESRFQLVKISD
jgi:hypothetical protein